MRKQVMNVTIISKSNIRQLISYLLMAAILVAIVFPAHYHIHHLSNDNDLGVDAGVSPLTSATSHAHTIDLHVLAEKVGQSHHDEATSIAISPDGIVNKSKTDFFPFILLAVVLLLMPMLRQCSNVYLNYARTSNKQRYPNFIPPLRAPPLF